jgi:hypothetical protein
MSVVLEASAARLYEGCLCFSANCGRSDKPPDSIIEEIRVSASIRKCNFAVSDQGRTAVAVNRPQALPLECVEKADGLRNAMFFIEPLPKSVSSPVGEHIPFVEVVAAAWH